MTWGLGLMRTPVDRAEPGACKEPGRRAAGVALQARPHQPCISSPCRTERGCLLAQRADSSADIPDARDSIRPVGQRFSHTGSTPELPGTLCAPAGGTGPGTRQGALLVPRRSCRAAYACVRASVGSRFQNAATVEPVAGGSESPPTPSSAHGFWPRAAAGEDTYCSGIARDH